MDKNKENSRLKGCIQRITEVTEAVEPLYGEMQQMVFAPVDGDKMLDMAQLWMMDGGRSAESSISAITFEKLVRAVEAKKNPTLNKILYWNDVEAWLNAVQDILGSTKWMLEEFYASLPCVENKPEELIDTAILGNGADGRKCYVAANSQRPVGIENVHEIAQKQENNQNFPSYACICGIFFVPLHPEINTIYECIDYTFENIAISVISLSTKAYFGECRIGLYI